MPRPRGHPRSLRARPELQRLEPKVLLTTFTLTSPTRGALLPAGVSPVGGIVIDLIGEGGSRVVSQIRARDLFVGDFEGGNPPESRGNPGTIGERPGFSPAVVDALGGALAELSVRLTVDDGDTGPGDFDRDDNTLLLNGIAVGRFDRVPTVETDASGTAILSENPEGGFRNDRVDTGFFHVTDPEVLRLVLDSIRDTGAIVVQLLDDDPGDNFFDFTVGIDAALIDVDLPPEPQNRSPRITSLRVEEPVVEGRPSRVIVSASDPDADDAITFRFALEGDGRIEPSETPGEAWLTVPRDGTVRLSVRVEDDRGAFDEAGRAVVVRNAAPSVTVAADQDAIEGREAILAIGSFDDPGLEDGWSVAVDWGDGSAVETFPVDRPGPIPPRPHRYLQDGDYSVTVRVSDGADASEASALVRVRNAPPALQQVLAPRRVTLGTPVDLAAAVSDPGILDPLTVSIDWGAGEPSRIDLPPGSTAFESAFLYDRIGSFVITVTVSDDRQESAVLGVPVTVEAPEPVPPAQAADQALAEALLPADPADPRPATLAIAPDGPGRPAPAPSPSPATLAAPIATLVGQDAPDPAPRASSPPPIPVEAPSAVVSAEQTAPAAPPPPTESAGVAAGSAEAPDAAAVGPEAIASASPSPAVVDPGPDPDPDATMAPETATVAPAVGAADAAEAASSTAVAAGDDDPGAETRSGAMRATVLIVAALTVRRGGSRIRQSLRSASVRSARS
ncbi:PKD domain-containing protein [Tautonia sp. JC769]|uniref:PKD domain-containing protein n=1 Tax=Tautonia sp. JC769 TaxID=3232135 RepID=UPI00345B1233